MSALDLGAIKARWQNGEVMPEDYLALVAEVERLAVVKDAIREDRDVLLAQRDEARARIEAALALCDEVDRAGPGKGYVTGFVAITDLRAALSPQEGSDD